MHVLVIYKVYCHPETHRNTTDCCPSFFFYLLLYLCVCPLLFLVAGSSL